MESIKHTRQRQLCLRIKRPISPSTRRPVGHRSAPASPSRIHYFYAGENTLDSVTLARLSPSRMISVVLQHAARVFHNVARAYRRCNTPI